MTAPARRAALAKVHAGRKELGLDEDTYRDLVERVTGRRSAADCTDAQLGLVIDELARKGAFKGVSRGRSKASRNPLARKVHALWKSCAEAGAVRNGSREALRAFCGRMVHPGSKDGVAVDPDMLAGDDLIKIAEALKAMERRAKGTSR